MLPGMGAHQALGQGVLWHSLLLFRVGVRGVALHSGGAPPSGLILLAVLPRTVRSRLPPAVAQQLCALHILTALLPPACGSQNYQDVLISIANAIVLQPQKVLVA